MLKFWKSVVSFVLLVSTLGILVLNPTTASAATIKSDLTFVWGFRNDTYYRVSKDNAPLRRSASDSGSIITWLDKGDFVKVVGTVRTIKATRWLKVSYFSDGKVRTGYLYSGNAKKYNVNVNGMRTYAGELFDECSIYAYWGITRVQAMDLANTASSKADVKNNLMMALKSKLEKAVGKSMDVSGYKTKTRYTYTDGNGVVRKNWGLYEKSGGCTWYAFNRYLEINGTELMFKGAGGGDAKNWDERINTSYFSKISTAKLKNQTINAIAVDNEGSRGYGHVAFIELVLDGYVFYSHGGYTTNGAFNSRLEMKSINEFAEIFETVLIPNGICRMP